MLILSIFTFKDSLAQTVTLINYQNWTPPPPAQCNVFGPTQVVNGREHLSTIGQPVYDAVNDAVVLVCSPVNGNKGMEYQIAYPFKQGFKYTIRVNVGSNITTPPQFPNYLRTELTSQGFNGLTTCNGMQAISNTTTGPKIIYKFINDDNYSDYDFIYPEQSSSSNFLRIAAVPATGTQQQIMYIRSVRIEETAVNPDLVLSPTQVNAACGTNVNQTFTVSNPYNASNITSYDWNLGSASNGWIYNGSPAPQFINTTGNTLSLTADGCRTVNLSNVLVTVNRNGAPYRTYGATVSTTMPSMSVNGSESICTGSQSYSINNLPCNAQVAWSSSEGTLSCTNCTQTSLASGFSGVAMLTATVQACGSSPVTLTKDVYSGIANNSFDIILYLPQPEGCYDAWSFYVFRAQNSSGTGHTGYQWSYRLQGSTTETILPSTSTDAAVTFNSPGTYEVVVRATNSCGVGTYQSIKTVEVVEFCTMSGWPSNLLVSPVPANGTLSITNKASGGNRSAKTAAAVVSRIQVIDKMGNTRIDRRVSGNASRTSLDVSGLANDMYVLRIFDGKKWWSKQIIIQH
jgi:hypothetical protein